MPQTKAALQLSKFLRGCIVGQCEGGISQRYISKNLSIPLATVNRVIVKCTRVGMKCTASRSCRQGY